MKRISVTNESIGSHETWTEGGRTFTELCRQSYGGNGAYFATGIVGGDPVEQVYFQWGKDGQPTGMFLLRADELAAIAWVASGTLWAVLLDDVSPQ